MVRKNPLALLRATYADRQYPRLKAAIKKTLGDQVRKIAATAALGGKLVITRELSARWSADLQKTIRPYVVAMTAHGWELATDELQPVKGKTQIGGVEIGRLPDGFLQRADFGRIDKWIATTSDSASATSATRLQNIFERAAGTYDEEKQQGATPKDIAKQILSEGLTKSESRAEMLAHTGAMWAYNEGAGQRYKDMGVAIVEWLTADDDLRCPFCAEMNGKRVETQEPFWKSGDVMSIGEQSLKVPSGSRGFDIRHPPLHPNCRCTMIPVIEESFEPEAPPPPKPAPAPDTDKPVPVARAVKDKGEKLPRRRKVEEHVVDEHPPAVRKTLDKVETQIASKPKEEAFIVDDTGKVLLHKKGDRSSVGFTDDEVKMFKGAVVTHNHPGGTSFSPADVKMLIRHDAKEMRAVDDRYVHSISRTPGAPKIGTAEIHMTYNAELKTLADEYSVKYRRGEINKKDAAAEISHLAWERVAAKPEFGLQYKRRKRDE